jgi:hypothetical protein
MNILVDHNLRGHSVVLAGSLAASGWLDLITINFVLFESVGLAISSDDPTPPLRGTPPREGNCLLAGFSGLKVADCLKFPSRAAGSA